MFGERSDRLAFKSRRRNTVELDGLVDRRNGNILVVWLKGQPRSDRTFQARDLCNVLKRTPRTPYVTITSIAPRFAVHRNQASIHAR